MRPPAPAFTYIRAETAATIACRNVLRVGERLWILNNDSRTHNVRIFDQAFDFDSGAQEPGETVEVMFPRTGSFLLTCGMHPKMELRVRLSRDAEGDWCSRSPSRFTTRSTAGRTTSARPRASAS